MKKYIICIFCLISNYVLFTFETVFDQIEWSVDSNIKDVKLYYYTDGVLSFFKAETIINDIKPEIITDSLMNFDKYYEIFPKTDAFKEIKQADNNNYIMYTCLDFFPMKKRDAFIDMTVDYCDDSFNLYWKPYQDKSLCVTYNDKIRTDRIYGRWVVTPLENNEVRISVEYSNDWKIPNVSNNLLVNIQKGTTADALRNLLKYARKIS